MHILSQTYRTGRLARHSSIFGTSLERVIVWEGKKNEVCSFQSKQIHSYLEIEAIAYPV